MKKLTRYLSKPVLYSVAPLLLVTQFTQCEPACTVSSPPVSQIETQRQIESKYGVALWDRIARCESGGNWSHPPVTNSSGTYSGGLMIGHRWWIANGGTEFAAYPYQAGKAEQIIVAERIASQVGLDRGWQCY